MFDIKWIRDDPEVFDEGMAKRGLEPQSARLIALDDERRAQIAVVQDAQTERNTASKAIGKAKASGDETAAQEAITVISKLKNTLQEGEAAVARLTAELRAELSALPNIPGDGVPAGVDEADNELLRTVGEPTKLGFAPKEHYDLGETLGQMDFETAAALSGSRFVILSGPLARLERALGQFMLDLHTQVNGYMEVAPPVLVREEALFGTGQLPKFAEDQFRTTGDHWLIPTAEVSLTNLVREQVLAPETLPRRYTALTQCFRAEAGSAGRDTRGMLRQHQFSKVEMVSITDAESGEAELERMLGCAEEVLKRLQLPYRVMTLCAGDMGFSAHKTFDIEVWLPGQDAYREISSCSFCGDFQARRMDAKYRDSEKKTEFVHTLNGSGIAVGRALIAVMENYQNEDGSITIPEALRPYFGNETKIEGV
jgi:seryl-tRNA synthetase